MSNLPASSCQIKVTTSDIEAERQAFREHLNRVQAEVKTWPQWKQQILGRTVGQSSEHTSSASKVVS